MIIVRKITGSGMQPDMQIALCEEVRRTSARIYVEIVKTSWGSNEYSSAVMGNKTSGRYAEFNTVISWDATEAQFDAMVARIKKHNLDNNTLRVAIRDLWNAADQDVLAIARNGIASDSGAQ